MATAYIELTKRATDEDGWWYLTVTVADATYVVQQEFYAYPSKLLEWAGQLLAFPKKRMTKSDLKSSVEDLTIGCGFGLGSSMVPDMGRLRSISGAQAMTSLDGQRILPFDATWRP